MPNEMASAIESSYRQSVFDQVGLIGQWEVTDLVQTILKKKSCQKKLEVTGDVKWAVILRADENIACVPGRLIVFAE